LHRRAGKGKGRKPLGSGICRGYFLVIDGVVNLDVCQDFFYILAGFRVRDIFDELVN
jgi:hypothetical protein